MRVEHVPLAVLGSLVILLILVLVVGRENGKPLWRIPYMQNVCASVAFAFIVVPTFVVFKPLDDAHVDFPQRRTTVMVLWLASSVIGFSGSFWQGRRASERMRAAGHQLIGALFGTAIVLICGFGGAFGSLLIFLVICRDFVF